MDVYDIASQKWSIQTMDLYPESVGPDGTSPGIEEHCTISYDNKLYIIGGIGISDSVKTLFKGYIVHDTETDHWLSKRNITMTLPLRKLTCTLTYWNNLPTIFVVGLAHGYADMSNSGKKIPPDLQSYPGPVTFTQALNLAQADASWQTFPSIPRFWKTRRHFANFGK